MDESVSGAVVEVSEVVKEYKIHVSSKYLERTRKKLELTRLPHELGREDEGRIGDGVWDEYGSDDGISKSEIEPLIDYWLEQYSWRTQESHLNTIPQFRTAISLSPDTTTTTIPPLRLHFIHIPSPNPTAIPLLLIPPFPFTNLSLGPLITAFTTPFQPQSPNENENQNQTHTGTKRPERQQDFHLIIPSIPGLGFSDAFTTPSTASNPIRHTAELFNALMLRLGYESYIVSTTSSPSTSNNTSDHGDLMKQIPTHLALLLSRNHPGNCLAIHLFDPILHPPSFKREPLAWLKFRIAMVVGGGVFGYERDDISLLKRLSKSNSKPAPYPHSRRVSGEERGGGRFEFGRRTGNGLGRSDRRMLGRDLSAVGLGQTAILSYALCDSPVGILAYTLSTLKSFIHLENQQPQLYPNPNPESRKSLTPSLSTDIEINGSTGNQEGNTTNSEVEISGLKIGGIIENGNGDGNDSEVFSKEQIINFTQLLWLPGPEALLRYLEFASVEIASLNQSTSTTPPIPTLPTSPNITNPNAITQQSNSQPSNSQNTSKSKSLLGITTFTPPPSKPPLSRTNSYPYTPIPSPWLYHTYSSILPNISVISESRKIGWKGLVGFLEPEVVAGAVGEFVGRLGGGLVGIRGSGGGGEEGGEGSLGLEGVVVDGQREGVDERSGGYGGRGSEGERNRDGIGLVALNEGQSPDTLVRS